MTQALDECDRTRLSTEAVGRLKRHPFAGRAGRYILFFASADSDYVTGQVLAADGGVIV